MTWKEMFQKKDKKTGCETPEYRRSTTPPSAPAKEEQEEWIWVDGYKGTDKNMQCRGGYQYELGKQYDIADDQEVVTCNNGFHLCLNFKDVYHHYPLGCGNRFFKVKALVRAEDVKQYGRQKLLTWSDGTQSYGGMPIDKIVSKSIIFVSEFTMDQLLQGTPAETLPEEYKRIAIDVSPQYAIDNYQADTLLEDGYSKPFALHMVKSGKFDIAHAVGSQKDLSMDMKVLVILYEGELK